MVRPSVARRPLVVGVITRGRRAELELTLRSVLNQARAHGHLGDLKIVVSDQSKGESLAANVRLVKALNGEFGGVVRHCAYGRTRGVQKLLRGATVDERKAFKAFVPAGGHWGANRNHLALCCALAAGRRSEEAAFLLLDDDTPMLCVDSKRRRLVERDADVIGAFHNGFEAALRKGKVGFSGDLLGVPDTWVSHERRRREDVHGRMALDDFLAKPSFMHSGHHCGPGRIVSFKVMVEPYAPYGSGEDSNHLYAWGNSYHGLRRTSAKLAHLGFTGVRPVDVDLRDGRSPGIWRHRYEFERLVRRAAGLDADYVK